MKTKDCTTGENCGEENHIELNTESVNCFSVISKVPYSKLELPMILGRSCERNALLTVGLESLPHLLIASNANPESISPYVCELLKPMMCKHAPDMLQFDIMTSKDKDYAGIHADYIRGGVLAKDVESVKRELQNLNDIMTERYQLLHKAKASNVHQYNMNLGDKQGSAAEVMNYIVAIVDDYSTFWAGAAEDIQPLIVSLAQLSRAVGIHLIIATTNAASPCLDGFILANVEARIALKMKDKKDYRALFNYVKTSIDDSELHVLLNRESEVKSLRRVNCVM
jgi:S-DNA-T family DNA segregation ATPase FtsK/SpoIIIE